MTGTEQTAGMLIDPAGACLPVKLEVERYGRRPVLVTANGSLPNGRYKLLCGAWLAAVVCIDGELEIADALAELRMSAEQRRQFRDDQAACAAASRKKKKARK